MTNPDLQLAPIHFPVVGNSVIVGIVSLLHIALASLSVGFMRWAAPTRSIRHWPAASPGSP